MLKNRLEVVVDVARLRKLLKNWIRRHGYEVRKLSIGEMDDIARLVRLAQSRKIHTFLDVGANCGQFAIDLRVAGYSDQIISFEPLSAAYRQLTHRAETDQKWTVAERMALGRAHEKKSINIAGNSFSSSLLPMGERHLESAPCSAYVGVEEIVVERLDEVLHGLGIGSDMQLALKIDTQGYEGEVLAGAEGILHNVKVLFTELSLAPVYVGAPSFDEIYMRLVGLGYRCVAISHEYSDYNTGEMLQVNGTFVRD